MAVTIDSLFGLQQMGESVALFEQPPIPLRLQESVFMNAEPCYADVYRFDREDFELALPPFVAGRTSPSKAVKGPDKQPEYIGLAHIKVHHSFNAADLFTMRSPGELSDNAANEIAKIRGQLRNRVKLAKERLCAMAMRGSIVINSTNFPETEHAITITRAVTTTTAQSASWALPATKIVTDDVQDWRNDIRNATGFELARLLFNCKVTGYLLQNTQVIDWISKTQRGVNTFETAMLGAAGGVPAWEEYNGFYKPEGGSVTPFIADDEVFALPADGVLRQICRMIEGYGEIPVNAIGGPGGGGAVAGAVKAGAPGIFEYALPLDGDPPGIKIVVGWYGMPLIKLPTAIGYQASVIA